MGQPGKYLTPPLTTNLIYSSAWSEVGVKLKIESFLPPNKRQQSYELIKDTGDLLIKGSLLISTRIIDKPP